MKVAYMAQPDVQLGRILADLLDATPPPKRIVFVSAFVSVQTIVRIKPQILALRDEGTHIRFVLGIDLGGTSSEVLRELHGWGVDARIVKHRIPGHTFHPKIYLFERPGQAEIIIGSNNLTEGGFFGNYEGSARVTYRLPHDLDAFTAACNELGRFLDPAGPVVYELTSEFVEDLIERGEVPSEAEARLGRDVAEPSTRKTRRRDGSLFGTEDFDPPPPLPAELLERLLSGIRKRRRATKRVTPGSQGSGEPASPIDDQVTDPLLPAAFYMTLPTLQGDNIPGEGRIPLEAIELAKQFWGWPDEYTKEVSPRSGNNRVYWNWRPSWRIWSAESPAQRSTQMVRMYMYENSSDFRFYVRPLVNAGGDLGDVVRIRRVAHDEFECILARKGTRYYDDWVRSCTQPVRGSERRFGYA